MTPRTLPTQTSPEHAEGDRPRIGASACLLGRPVRYDGGGKRDRYLTGIVEQFFELVPVCPEVESGLGTPRETLRLVGGVGSEAPEVQLISRSGLNRTALLRETSGRLLRRLASEDLSGFVLKSGSPSCGMERVRVYDANGVPSKSGRGIFARALIEAFPSLPVEEEGRLNDPAIRENFFARVHAHRRLTRFFRTEWTLGSLSRFHACQKLQVLAHDPERYRRLGRLVATAKGRDRVDVAASYTAMLMSALQIHSTRGRHANVLQHMLGYFSQQIDESERHELVDLVEDYRTGLVPLGVPMTLLSHHLKRHGLDYLLQQTYLSPYRRELKLRDAV